MGKSVPTITRAIKKGDLSAEPRQGGGWLIDPSELFRVWPAVTAKPFQNSDELGRETGSESMALRAEVEKLKLQLQAATNDLDKEARERERERQQLESHLADLRMRAERAEAESQRLLTDQREGPVETSKAPVGFFGRLRRRLEG